MLLAVLVCWCTEEDALFGTFSWDIHRAKSSGGEWQSIGMLKCKNCTTCIQLHREWNVCYDITKDFSPFYWNRGLLQMPLLMLWICCPCFSTITMISDVLHMIRFSIPTWKWKLHSKHLEDNLHKWILNQWIYLGHLRRIVKCVFCEYKISKMN